MFHFFSNLRGSSIRSIRGFLLFKARQTHQRPRRRTMNRPRYPTLVRVQVSPNAYQVTPKKGANMTKKG